jgi:hypothetical protein
MRIRIADLDPQMLQNDPISLAPFHFDTDPDPAFHFDADPDLDLDPSSKNDANPCVSGSAALKKNNNQEKKVYESINQPAIQILLYWYFPTRYQGLKHKF